MARRICLTPRKKNIKKTQIKIQPKSKKIQQESKGSRVLGLVLSSLSFCCHFLVIILFFFFCAPQEHSDATRSVQNQCACGNRRLRLLPLVAAPGMRLPTALPRPGQAAASRHLGERTVDRTTVARHCRQVAMSPQQRLFVPWPP